MLRTNNINCFGRISVYGPNAACVPSSASAILNCQLLNGDPGVYPLLTGLTVGATYRIQYNGQDCGGGNDRHHDICIGIYNVANNNTVNTPALINDCGTIFNGTTQGGYSVSGTGVGGRNLDGNNATTCPACGGQPGADITFVINNDSWFTFCAANAGIWQVTFNVGSCVFSGVNSGLQMALFTGSPTALTWHSQAPNPTYTGGSWTSPTITLGAGQCAYLMVDGFAGDACSYSYQLTNVSGGCILLPIELLDFSGRANKYYNELSWITASEQNNDFFIIERSTDGIEFREIGKVKGAGSSSSVRLYNYTDRIPKAGTNYYRLVQTDFDGTTTRSKIIVLENKIAHHFEVLSAYPNPANELFTIELSAAGASAITVQVREMSGRNIMELAHTISDGANRIEIPVNQLAKGMYIVTLLNKESGKTEMVKLAVH
ncbi:MAG: T9SS type A sorting domain-containing protein [Flavobacteriales bacterium]